MENEQTIYPGIPAGPIRNVLEDMNKRIAALEDAIHNNSFVNVKPLEGGAA